MIRKKTYNNWLLVTGIAGALCACSADVDRSSAPEEFGQSDTELIGGVPVSSETLDVVGTLGFVYSYYDYYEEEPYEYFSPFCSGSVIGESTILTARHCIDGARYYLDDESTRIAFGVGPDGNNPERLLDVVAVEAAPGNYGGFVGPENDVGVAYLDDPVTDIKPLKLRSLKDKHVGKRFGAVGYGVRNNSSAAGKRLAGSLTLRGLEGQIYEYMFGSLEAYLENALDEGYYATTFPFVSEPPTIPGGGEMPSIPVGPAPIDDGPTAPPVGPSDAGVSDEDGGVGGDDWYIEYLTEQYEETRLVVGSEAFLGGVEGDAQPCYGDSGGPLLKVNKKGDLIAFGVVSGGIGSRNQICDYGAVYGTFSAEVLEFLKEARKWEDPCGEITTQGQCDGDEVLRCYGADRRVSRTDCSLLGMACGTDQGAVGCVDENTRPDPSGGADGGVSGPDFPPGPAPAPAPEPDGPGRPR